MEEYRRVDESEYHNHYSLCWLRSLHFGVLDCSPSCDGKDDLDEILLEEFRRTFHHLNDHFSWRHLHLFDGGHGYFGWGKRRGCGHHHDPCLQCDWPTMGWYLVALVFTLVCAVINASVGEFLHLPAVIGSIFLMFFAGGIQAIYFTNTEAVTLYGDFSFLKETWFQITFLVIFGLITFYLFKFTRLGKYTRAIGTNETVARQSGVNTWLFKFLAYAFLGLAIVFACVNSVNRVGTVTKSTGANFHMSIMIALILGGMPVSGGMKSRVSSAVVGTMIFNILETGLILSGVPASATMLVQSVILFAIIVLTCRRKDIKTLQR